MSTHEFTITRTGGIAIAASVDWAVTGSGDNPADATDFVGGVLPSGTASFLADETEKIIDIEVAGDSTVEPDEGFTVTLSNPSTNHAINPAAASASSTITNDDVDLTGDGALLNKTSGQTILSSLQALAWQAEVYDVGAWHDNSTNNTRCTVPSGVSLVRIQTGARDPSNNHIAIEHKKGGATFRGRGRASATSGGATNNNICSAPIAAAPGDYFETECRMSGGGADVGTDNETWMAIEALDASLRYALVYHNTTQALAGGAQTTLSFNSETADTDGFHDTATNNSRLTVPAALNGKAVRLCANVSDNAGGGGNQSIFAEIRKNGATARGLPARDASYVLEDMINLVSAPIVVATGDYFELDVFPDSAITVTNFTDVWFSIEEVPDTIKRALAHKSGNQTLSAATTTVLTFDAEVYDTDSIHDNSTNNSRLTVPSGCTKARPSFGIRSNSVTGQLAAWVRKNGATYRGVPAYDCDTPGTENLSAIGAWVDVVPGDYFELAAYSDNGCVIGSDNRTWFALECK